MQGPMQPAEDASIQMVVYQGPQSMDGKPVGASVMVPHWP